LIAQHTINSKFCHVYTYAYSGVGVNVSLQ